MKVLQLITNMLLTSSLRLQDLFQQGISAALLRSRGTGRGVLLRLIAALLVVSRRITTLLVVGVGFLLVVVVLKVGLFFVPATIVVDETQLFLTFQTLNLMDNRYQCCSLEEQRNQTRGFAEAGSCLTGCF
ncbi:hypothetical protein DY000_02024260 [Brassica cretica]|uniref:Uncharacterized protein n=1 Tax=Brassica cretica TaxID=69181 RepID=A0ABQ7E933_BRACR|nr:hypothetical protein DY000_02024260 [Brassica cretica]